MLSKVHHDNIVVLLGYCLHPTLFIAMEFVDGGTLEDFLGHRDKGDPLEFEEVMKILTGTAAGLGYLHAWEPLPILHRDIKSENILLGKNLEPQLADLGEARTMAQNRTMTTVGTNGYTAPEV